MSYAGADRREDVLSKLDGKVDHLIENQAIIRAQVTKTNGRVTVLEKFMWTVLGVTACFMSMELPNLIRVLK